MEKTDNPVIRVRVSADYQASRKGMVPDVTVEITPTVDADFQKLEQDAQYVRAVAVREFVHAYHATREVIEEQPHVAPE